MFSVFQRAEAASISLPFAECIRLAKKMDMARWEMQPLCVSNTTLNYCVMPALWIWLQNTYSTYSARARCDFSVQFASFKQKQKQV